MNPKILATLLAISVVTGFPASAQIYDTNGEYVQTFVGSGLAGYINGVGLETMFDQPQQMVADSSGNLFVCDSAGIRKITPDGTVSTFAGSVWGDAMAIDQNNTIWMTAGDVLYQIAANATVKQIKLPLPRPQGVCVDSLGNLYLSDTTSNAIFRCSATGALTLFAGSGDAGYMNGNGIFTAFNEPMAMTADTVGNIYVWDSGNELIRKIDQSKNVTTYAGQYPFAGVSDGSSSTAGFFEIFAMCFDTSGNLILACGTSIRQVTAAMNVNTLAGSFFTPGYTNGIGAVALFNGARGVAVTGGTIYVADLDNEVIRSITNNLQPQVVSGANLGIGTYPGVTITGAVGRTYQFQSSPDMSNWTTQATIVLPSSPFLWIDTKPISGNNFYRAVLVP